jgi:hypothetical protein
MMQEEKEPKVSIMAFQDKRGFLKKQKEISQTVIDWINELQES